MRDRECLWKRRIDLGAAIHQQPRGLAADQTDGRGQHAERDDGVGDLADIRAAGGGAGGVNLMRRRPATGAANPGISVAGGPECVIGLGPSHAVEGEAVVEGSRQPFSLPISPASMATEIGAFERAVTDSVAAAGSDAPATLAARGRLGRGYAVSGRFDDAVSVLTENMAATERARGPEHPDAIVARTELTWAWRLAGRVTEAMAAQPGCVADLDRALGPGSAQAARARIDYARLLTLTGQPDLARQVLEPALADLTRTAGSAHPDTLRCQMDLAAAERATGHLDEAVATAQRTAADCERLLDPDDPEAISCRAMLGAIYVPAGRTGEAVALLEGARADFDRVLGPEHSESIRAGTALASALRSAGQSDRAIAELEQTLTAAERVLVPQHRLTIAARISLALSYRLADRAAEAIPMMERAIRGFEPASRADVTQLRGFRVALAGCLVQAGRPAEGSTMAETLVAELEHGGEPADKPAVDGRLLLAALYVSASRRKEARGMYRAVLPDVRRVYGKDHEKTRLVEEQLRLPNRIRQSRLTLGAAVLITVALAIAAGSGWLHGQTPLPPAPAPGYQSPANAVAGYIGGLFTSHPATACRFTVPGQRAVCTDALSLLAPLAGMTGRWTIGHTVISGSRAIVDVEYRASGYAGKISMDNTDPNAGLPHAGLSFEAAYQQVFTSHYVQYATDCVLIDGRWYVDDLQSG